MWKEYYVYGNTFTNLPAGSGTTFTDSEIRIDTDADFEFIKTMFNPITSRVRLQYRDDTMGRFLQKGSQDCRTIGGHAIFTNPIGNPTPPGFLPFIWPRPYLIPAATTFTVSASDFSGLQSTFRLAFHGSKIRSGPAPWGRIDKNRPRYRAMVPYIYSVSSSGTVSMAANGGISVAIPTDNDAHFLVEKIVGARTGPCTLTVKDAARDRQWMNGAIHFDNFVGNGHYPNLLPSPRFIARGSVISISLNDLSGAANTVELNFIGVKLYE